MIAAIYARKSTPETGINDEEKSVTRQIEHAKAYAAKKGWTVAEELIFVDDGISGAEFVKRPGFLRLMNALKPRPPFPGARHVRRVPPGPRTDSHRLRVAQITDAGVRVFFYLTDQERKLDTAIEKIMGALAGFASEMEREKTSQRVHDALKKKAAALQVTGCKVYGYDNLEVLGPTGERLHVVRRINREEAAIVRRLFERYVAGEGGLATLAKELNGEGVAPPRGHRRGWAPSCVRAILHRELYRGIVVWNKTQAIMRHGIKTSRKRPEADWLRFDAPDLRIIPADLWERVDRKIQKTRHAFARTANGRLCGHPSGADLRSVYLLSGLAKCAICGGSLVAYKRRRGEGKDLYICVFHHKRGPAVCSNDHRIHQQTLDSALLHALTSVLDEQMIADAVRRALAEIRAGQTQFPDQRLALTRQLSLVEARIRHLVEAIASGRSTESVFTELHKEEAEKTTLTGQLDNLAKLVQIVSLDAARIERDLRARVADLKGLLEKHVPQTRQMLRKLLEGQILCTPFTDARGKGHEITATGSYAGLFRVPIAVNDGGGEGGI